MNMKYTNTITIDQYNSLREAVGWNVIHEELVANQLKNSAFLTVLTDNGAPVGLARVVTDYGYTVLIADVIVHPNYQGKGFGRSIMTNVMAYINENIAPGQRKMINLMAASGKEEFYKKFGFVERPNDLQGAGMSQWISGVSNKGEGVETI